MISLVVLDDLLVSEHKFDSNVLMLTSKIFSKNLEEEEKKSLPPFTEHPYYKSKYIPGSRYSASHNKAAATQERLGSWHGP